MDDFLTAKQIAACMKVLFASQRNPQLSSVALPPTSLRNPFVAKTSSSEELETHITTILNDTTRACKIADDVVRRYAEAASKPFPSLSHPPHEMCQDQLTRNRTRQEQPDHGVSDRVLHANVVSTSAIYAAVCGRHCRMLEMILSKHLINK